MSQPDICNGGGGGHHNFSIPPPTHTDFNFLLGFRPLHFVNMIKRCFCDKIVPKERKNAGPMDPDMRFGGGGHVLPVPPSCATVGWVGKRFDIGLKGKKTEDHILRSEESGPLDQWLNPGIQCKAFSVA